MTSEIRRRAAPGENEPITQAGAEGSLQDRDWYSFPRRRIWRPPTDVYETDEHVVVKVEIAGMQADDLNISFANRRLVIAGRRGDPVGKLVYQNMEIRYGEFRSEVRVGWPLDQSAIEATYEEGFLYVYLPKHTTEHRVSIRTRDEDDG